MKHILHDWNDEDCLRILDKVRQAIPEHGKLMIFDSLLPDPPQANEAVMMDLNMLVMTGGRERRQDCFANLFDRSGFKLTRVIRLPGLAQGIEAQPV